MYIDGELVIDNDGGHPAQTLLAKMALKKGFHTIKLDYFQMGRAKNLIVKWKSDNIDIEELPVEILFH